MANVGGFLQALGAAFGGYGKDQDGRDRQAQEMERLAMAQQAAGDEHLDRSLARYSNYPLMPDAGGAPAGPPAAPFDPTGFRQGLQQGMGGGGRASATSPLPPLSPSPSAAPASPMDALPTDAVDVPGYGRIDRFGGMKRGLMLKQLEGDIATNQKIRESQATGATDEHLSKSALNQREIGTPRLGDSNYADALGEVEAKKALATLPTQVRLEVLRGNISLSNALQVQHSQQAFTAGENTRRFNFDEGQQARQQEGTFRNESALTNQRARGTLMGRYLAPDAETAAPSSTPAPPRLTGEQVIRAARDPLYKQFLEERGYTLTPSRP